MLVSLTVMEKRGGWRSPRGDRGPMRRGSGLLFLLVNSWLYFTRLQEKKMQDFAPKLYVQPIRNLAAQARSGNGSTPGGKHVKVHQSFQNHRKRTWRRLMSYKRIKNELLDRTDLDAWSYCSVSIQNWMQSNESSNLIAWSIFTNKWKISYRRELT